MRLLQAWGDVGELVVERDAQLIQHLRHYHLRLLKKQLQDKGYLSEATLSLI